MYFHMIRTDDLDAISACMTPTLIRIPALATFPFSVFFFTCSTKLSKYTTPPICVRVCVCLDNDVWKLGSINFRHREYGRPFYWTPNHAKATKANAFT